MAFYWKNKTVLLWSFQTTKKILQLNYFSYYKILELGFNPLNKSRFTFMGWKSRGLDSWLLFLRFLTRDLRFQGPPLSLISSFFNFREQSCFFISFSPLHVHLVKENSNLEISFRLSVHKLNQRLFIGCPQQDNLIYFLFGLKYNSI